MRQKGRLSDTFFGFKGVDLRPTSIATEIVDTDWEGEDIASEIEYDEPNSPRSGQQSAATLSTYDEAQTPRSSRAREAYPFECEPPRPSIEGPRGPHLFRSSTASSTSHQFQDILTLSPITPKTVRPYESEIQNHVLQEPMPRSRSSPYQFSQQKLEPASLATWSPEMVAQWMLNAGIEASVAGKFIENDINGAILITLKFEDLRELHIKSFGVRTQVWEEMHVLRDQKEMSPRPDTPIEDEESKEVRRERKKVERAERGEVEGPKRSHSKRKPSHEDIISPLESVSIVGIEQMMPKPHHCSKGENCSKYRRQQRMIEAFMNDHPFVDMDKGGVIMVAGDPGNPQTAPAINRPSSTEALRPFSDAVPSVVASSDVLGSGLPPLQYLQEAALRNLQTQDPQDNVRQFLNFQHQAGSADAFSEVPPTPPYEVYPGGRTPQPHEGLRALPKLSIPDRQQTPRQTQPPPRPSTTQPQAAPFVPHRMSRAEAKSPELQTPIYRFGTPFSDMDVPLTRVPLGPVARDASQSVPPDMNYRADPVGVSRGAARSRASSHRPSLQIMDPVDEDAATTPTMGRTNKPPSPSSSSSSSRASPPRVPSRPHNPLHAPPRAPFPWAHQQRIAAATGAGGGAMMTTTRDAEGVTYQGPVRKRRTRMLRHEWHDQYAVLRGTRLALHRPDNAASSASVRDRQTLEYIDIDDYAIACSSLSATSKLSAAFRAMNISRGGSGGAAEDVAAFSFQLVPQDPVAGMGMGRRLRKRESRSQSIDAVVNNAVPGPEGAANGTGKAHHFAVRSRDERIDWMRELMLAKALKQKGEGFEVSVNGNMI
ncbi:hypothetical protein GGR56DRAFT_663326 [Xylariaceae sp. FL0804]|nr:hypothetical protein GGR56DRAFT_663326 [Xylariaceae sp. FL0804]